MRHRLASLALGLVLALAASSTASAQCSGNPAAGRVCGNPTSAATLPTWATQTSMLDRAFGTTQGTVLNRQGSAWIATVTPFLGAAGGNSGALILEGGTSGSATLSVQSVAGNTSFHFPVGNGSLGFGLITDGAGNTSWSSVGSGTVTSVGLALPSALFTVTNSPVTSTGTLTGTLTTQSANLVWAGPTTGSASAPTFRSLVGADLPNPSATTLGGIESLAAVTSNWIRAISTSGVPTASQPAFTDISGTLAPAQCPNPSATTLGCVESYVAVAHQWINSISTAGVPSSTQPNFTDLTGAATLAQLPSISNSSVLGNNSGGTAVPSALSASNVLDFIGAVQGDVLYRSASGWSVLAPGTNGFVLTTGGASANPSWTNPASGGTVTSIATNNGITGGTITTTGTIGLATIPSGTVLANITGGSAVPISNTPSSILDIIGSATGNILYRTSGSGWAVLAPGTNGQVLTQGASTPAWGNAGTLTNVTITAGTGLAVTGTCNISTSGTCTPALASIAAGTVLGNNSTSSAVPTAQSAPLLLNTLTASNSATLSDITSLTSTYSFYEIVFESLIPATNNVDVQLLVRAGGVFQPNTYVAKAISPNGTAILNNNVTTYIPLGDAAGDTSNASPGISGSMRVYSPSTSAIHSWIGLLGISTGGNIIPVQVTGMYNSAVVIDGFQIKASTGNITSGVVKIYGYQ